MATSELTIPPDVKSLPDLEIMFKNLLPVFLGLGGIIFFIMLIVGGFKYMTGGGDPKALEGAKKTITTALAGLILLFSAYLIILLVEKITGVPISTFTIVGK